MGPEIDVKIKWMKKDGRMLLYIYIVSYERLRISTC